MPRPPHPPLPVASATDRGPAPHAPTTPPSAPTPRGLGVHGRLVLLVVAAVLPFLLLIGLRARERAAEARAAQGSRAAGAARAVAARLDERARHVQTLLAAVGPQLQAGDTPGAVAANNALLLAVKLALPAAYVTNLAAHAPDGRHVGTSRRPLPAPEPVATADRPYFREVLAERGLGVGAPMRARAIGSAGDARWTVPFAHAVADAATGEVRLVVVGSVHLAGLAPLARAADLPEGSRVTVADARGLVVAAWPHDPTRLGGPAPGPLAGAITGRAAASAAPWAVRVELPRRAALAAVWPELARDLLLGGLTLALALLLALAAARRISRPLRALAADAEALAAGDRLPAPAPAPAGELGALAVAFGHMAATIAARTAALHKSEQRHRLLFEACPLPTYLVDVGDYTFRAVNDATVAQYGYTREEFAQLTLVDLRPPEDRLLFLAAGRPGPGGARGDPARLEAGVWRHVRKDGRQFDVEVYTALTEFEGRPARLSVAVDVTARRAAERALRESQEQLRRAQKMEALGRFAGGISHDFNNLLTGILGACDLALSDLPEGATAREDVEMIRDSARRAAALTGQILAFSRGGVVQPTVLRVSDVVNGLAPMLTRVIGEHIRLVIQAPPPDEQGGGTGGHVTADRGQLEQVVMNLVLNGRDAMPDGGTLVVRVDDVTLDAESADHPGVAPGAWVRLAVSDTGVGMDEATQARIFEPFFTTKARGKGTGLGLATVYGIVRQAGGVVRVASARGAGSTFALYLPRADAGAHAARRATPPGALPAVAGGDGANAARANGAPQGAAAATATPPNDTPVARYTGGGETILLVEDEHAVRAIARAALTRRGYRVLSAADAAEALAITRAYPGPISLLLTDVVMPGMGGRELAEHVAAERPGVRVLFTSGYTEDEVLHRGVSTEAMAFLPKPFTPDALASRVRSVLDAPVAALAG